VTAWDDVDGENLIGSAFVSLGLVFFIKLSFSAVPTEVQLGLAFAGVVNAADIQFAFFGPRVSGDVWQRGFEKNSNTFFIKTWVFAGTVNVALYRSIFGSPRFRFRCLLFWKWLQPISIFPPER